MTLLWVLMAILASGFALLFFNHGAGETFGIANDDFAHMVVATSLMLFLAAALLRRRTPLSDLVRNAGVWALLALLLVAGYQFRYELQDAASRLSAGLVPGSPMSFVDAEGRESVYVERAAGGHFEAQVRINGEPVRAIVDTGASATVLTAADARRVGLDPDGLTFQVPVATANGRAQAARAEAREISLGSITRRDVTVLVAQPEALGQSLLGMNFIGSLSGFDMRGDRLILRD